MKRLHTSLIPALVATLFLVVFASVASAAWEPFKAARDARDRASTAIRTEAGRAAENLRRAHQKYFVARITNVTRSFVNCSFNGERQIAIGPREAVTFQGIGEPTIAFDNARSQNVRHGLNNKGLYAFRWVNGTLVLHRR